MSSFDPVAALAAQAIANAQNAIQTATLDLGNAAQALQAQISVGDLLDAIVLPPQNGVDRIALFGQTFAAQLPPGVNPGESLLLQVTSFQGQQIVVRNLGPIDPQNPPRTLTIQLPTAPAAQPSTPSSPTQRQAPPPSTSVAPPREVFVAASVRPTAAQNGPAPVPQRIVASIAPKNAGTDVELRLAANRAGVPTARVAQPPNATAIPALRSTTVPVRPLPQQTPQAALLARLRVPVSAATLVAARLMDDAAQHVTTSYHRLDGILAQLKSADPRIGSLRSLVSFVGKIDVRNARALPEQIAAFVSHVVDGAESKVAQIVRALTEVAAQASALEQETPTSTPSAPAAASNSLPNQPLAIPVNSPSVSNTVPPATAAHVTERTVALEHDVKAAILSLLQNPPRGISQAATQALSSALGATTALQLNVLSARNDDPSAIAIPLPAYFYEGGKPAHLRISRDPAQDGKRSDGDNFHVTFVLDTKTMGTVAIDVQTVSRAVSIDVKTERTAAASRFKETFSDLRARLEHLRYRVTSTAAGVAPAAAAKPDATAPQSPPAVQSNVDLRA